MKINELVAGMNRFLDNLRIIDGYFNELESSLSPEEHNQLFINFDEVLHISAEWLRLLKQRQQQDPAWTKPIGELLMRGAQLMSNPLTEFCSKVQHSHEFVAELADISPAFADDLVEIQEEMKTDISLTTALTLPAEQVITIQQTVAFIANATPIFDPDRDLVLQARNAFDSISAKILTIKPRPTYTISLTYNARTRASVRARGSVRHSQIFDPRVMANVLASNVNGAANNHAAQDFISQSASESNTNSSRANLVVPSPTSHTYRPQTGSFRPPGGSIREDEENEVFPSDTQAQLASSGSSMSFHSALSGTSHNTAASSNGYSTGATQFQTMAASQLDRDRYSPAHPVATSTPSVAPQHSKMPSSPARQSLPWLFGTISKEKAEQLLMADTPNNGRFLVRERAGYQGEYVLSLVYQGVPTHHLITRNSDNGIYTVNRKMFGSPRSLREVIDILHQPQLGWPQVLTSYISNLDISALA